MQVCLSCGQIYLTPRPAPDELARYYPQDYILFSQAIEDEPSALRRLDRAYGLHKRCREVIRRAGPSGRILDVGCATGIFLNGMQQRGWQAVGIEPSHFAAEYARKRFGLEVVEGFLEDTNFAAESFDAVSLWDVLEHVYSPAETLAEIARLLKPGGWLVMSLPNPESWERAWFGRYWAGWEVPRHFHLFTRAVLKRYLQDAGLWLSEVSSFTGRHGVLVMNVDFWMTDWSASPERKQQVSRAIRSLPARVLTWPYFSLADRLNKSSIMTVFARKL